MIRKIVEVNFTKGKPLLCSFGYEPGMIWLEEENPGKFISKGAFHTCRETFTEELFKNKAPLNKIAIALLVKPYNCAMKDFDVKIYENFVEAYAKRFVRVINIVEKELGWARTKLYFPDNFTELVSAKASFFVIRPSTKWLKYTPILSIYLLLARYCSLEKMDKFKDIEDLKKLRTFLGSEDSRVIGKPGFSIANKNAFTKDSGEWLDVLKYSRKLFTNTYAVIASHAETADRVTARIQGICKFFEKGTSKLGVSRSRYETLKKNLGEGNETHT